jgi:hypothetical protein
MREDKERKGNGEWRMENEAVAPQFSILHSPLFPLGWEVQMTKYKVPQRHRGRKENLNTLRARRLCGSILLFLAQRLRQWSRG